MEVLLLAALACLVSAAEEPLQFSGNFNTIYLAGKRRSTTNENSPARMLMRKVETFKNNRVMSMTYYLRKNGMCQQQTAWADKLLPGSCLKSFVALFTCKEKVSNKNSNSITGFWEFSNAPSIFPNIYYHSLGTVGGLSRTTGTNITEEMWETYVNLTRKYQIPLENIENVYKADTCPKGEP